MFSWLRRGGHGRGKTQNGSRVHYVNQDSWLEVLFVKTLPTKSARKKFAFGMWLAIQAVFIALFFSFSCRAAWYERKLETQIHDLQSEVEQARKERQERQEFLKRMQERP